MNFGLGNSCTTFCIFAILSLTFTLVVVESKLPSSLGSSCSVKADNWPVCIKNSIERARPFLARGDFGEGFIVPKFEPLYIKRLAMMSNDVNVTISDSLVNGPSNFEVKKIKPKLEDLSVEAIIHSPVWTFAGKYVLDVKAGPIEITGKGDIQGEFNGIDIKFRVKLSPYQQDGINKIRFQKFQMRIKIKDGKLHLDNLFNGDPVLGDFGNQFINTRTQVIINHLEPEVEKDLTVTCSKLLATLFRDVTFDEVFPSQ